MFKMRTNPRKKDNIYRILIVEPNWLGDVIFTTPAIRAVRKHFSGAYISCWCVPRVAEILRENPNIDNLLLYDERRWYLSPWDCLKFIVTLHNRCFDLAILFHRSTIRSLFVKLADVAYIVGEQTVKRRSFRLLDKSVEVEKNKMHRVDYYLSIVSAIGVEPDGYHYDINYGPEEIFHVTELLNKHGIREKFAVLNPGANWERKRWPVENFAELAERIVSQLDWDVILSGAVKDIWLCEQVLERCARKDRIFNLAGKTTLGQLAYLLSQASIVVSNDSGPLHIAAAVNKRVIGIFGATSPSVTGLYGDLKGNNLFSSVKCQRPCYKDSCDNELLCMRSISVDMVMNKIRDIIGNDNDSVRAPK